MLSISLTRAAFICAFPGTMATHTAGKLQFSQQEPGVCAFIPIFVVPPSVAVLRDGGSWWVMSAHVHAGTLGYLHTAGTIQNFTHWKTQASPQELEWQRGSQWEVTRAFAAVHTVFLTDLLNIETVAGCGAGLGAFAVLHPDWTLGDLERHLVHLMRLLNYNYCCFCHSASLQHWLSSCQPWRSVPCAWHVRANSSRNGQ